MNDSCWCASTNPVEDVFATEPPSSTAEPLRDQQAAQVRATHRLLVAADEVGNLERRQQSVRQPGVRWRLGRSAEGVWSMRRFRNRDRLHGSSSAHLAAPNGSFSTGLLGMSASRFVPSGVNDLWPITTLGWLCGRAQSGAMPATLAARGRYARREADVRDARAAPAIVRGHP
jgi:hypothetical protein